MNAVKNALLNLFACIPVSWIMAILVLGTVALIAVAVMAGLNFLAG